MLFKIIYLIVFYGCIIFAKSNLQWNINEPYLYNGFIYTDSKVVIINPAIQIKIVNNEEICNFYVNNSDITDDKLFPFRAVVKSASLGLGELEIKPSISLGRVWTNKEIKFHIMAEACHDPDSWSVPALVSIQVLEPPGPLWTKKSYNVVVNNNVPIGTTVLKVMAYLPKWTNVENKICQYLIKSPSKSPFRIDGEGTIKTKEKLGNIEVQYITLIVAAQDCSQPVHRESKVNVFVSVNASCKIGWTGFYTLLNYKPGSGIKYISKNPRFRLCDYTEQEDSTETFDPTISNCMANKTLRLTTSVELKAQSLISTDAELNDQTNCKLDFESLKLQREVCGINDSKTLELLTELNRQRTGVLMFPIQANIFPTLSTIIENKFSFFFWMKREKVTEPIEEFIICQIDEAGDNIFSVSMSKCVLKIKLRSYKIKYRVEEEDEGTPTIWKFSLPQLCDSKWHHTVIVASRASENPSIAEMNLFIDGEIVEFKNDNPEIILNTPLHHILSNMTDVFLGQCPKVKETEFKGLLAGVTMTPGLLLKSSTSRCLTKCSDRLYFNGMNQMNPGMSVSLNSEMQMIIINGHNIAEVIKLVKAIGFVNPTWNPKPAEKQLTIETEMSCGEKVFNVFPVNVSIKIMKQTSTTPFKDMLNFIKLLSTVTVIVIPDSTQSNSDMGTGVAVFANTTLEMTRIPQSTKMKSQYEPSTVSKCVVTMHPRMRSKEYLDWPRHLLEAVSAEKYSIKVTNTSRTVVFQGLHNHQVYQFVIQHLRYFSSPVDDFLSQVSRVFRLQCFSFSGKSVVKSNIASVKVTIWYNNYNGIEHITTPRSSSKENITNDADLWKDIINNITMRRNFVPLHAQSNAALISEMDFTPRSKNNVIYNVLLSCGLLTLIVALIMLVRKSRKKRSREGCLLPYQVVDRICFPLQMIKERIKPSPSVRVELSRDFINCTSERRREISMEMQWDDTEMKSNTGFNIISNPMFEKSMDDIDDIGLNKDVPPTCEEEYSTTDDDTYEDFTELYFERNQNSEKMKVK